MWSYSRPAGRWYRRAAPSRGLEAGLAGAAAVVCGVVLAAAAFTIWNRTSISVEELGRRAWSDYHAGRFAEAEGVLRRRLSMAAPEPSDRVLQALVFAARGREDDALVALARIPDSDAMAPEARLQAAAIELRRGRARATEDALLHALRLDPRLVDARRELAYLYGLQLRRRECDLQYRALAGLTPLDVKLLVVWCQVVCSLWNLEEVRAKTERFVRADPGDRWSRLALAESLRRLNRPEEAEAALAPLPSSDADAQSIRAEVAAGRGDLAEAEALAATGPETHHGLEKLRGRLALARRDGLAAVRQFRAALAAEPDDRDASQGLAVALGMTGAAAEATACLRAVAEHDRLKRLLVEATTRNDPATLGHSGRGAGFTHLGQACEAAGRYAQARGWYLLAITDDALDTEAQRGLARLD